MAQLGRALRSGRRGRVFESRHSDFKTFCIYRRFFVWAESDGQKMYGVTKKEEWSAKIIKDR